MVAETAGELLGFAHVVLHRSTTTIAPVVYLQDFFTVDTARRNGAGRSLIQAVYRFATAAGSPRVYRQTHETNHIAMRLYENVAEKSGFVVYRKLL